MEYIIDNTKSINETLKNMHDFDTLILKSGIYKEKVKVLNNNITIKGEDRCNVIIENKDFFHKIMPDFNECNTFRTWTFYVGGDNVKLSNLTIKNSSVPSSRYGQAVALHVDGDYFTAEEINIISAQDTLFTGPLPRDLQERHKGFLEDTFRRDRKSYQKYINCYIEGDVDFIFGCATTLFYNSEIHSIEKELDKSKSIGGYLSAPSHEKETPYGYLFYKCRLTCDENAKNVYLSRPWRDYGHAAFIDCSYGKHILEEGFSNWSKTTRYNTAKFYEYSTTVDQSKRVKWSHILTKEEKDKYLEGFMALDKFFNV